MPLTPAQRSRQRRAGINARRELPEATDGLTPDESWEKQSREESEVIAVLIAMAAAAWSAWQAWQFTWPRLWVWHFGPDTSGADSIWNQEPIRGLMEAMRTLGETIVITGAAALVAGGVILSVLSFALWVVRRASPQGRQDARRRRAKGKPALYDDIQVRTWSDKEE
jgi:hypothetical protein